ncbi:MAG: electron transfer flavoprotein subunit alpha/FixB family protein [Candidatus Heimdallarchaeota archaeon]
MILVIIEISQGKIVGLSKECISAGKKLSTDLGTELHGVILGRGIERLATEATQYGLNKVYAVDDETMAGTNILYHARTLEALITQQNPQVVLAGATLYAQELVPRLAARFGKAMFASVDRLAVSDGEFKGVHPLFEEKLLATMEADTDQLTFATILSGKNPEVELDTSLLGEVIAFAPVVEESDKRETFVSDTIAKVSVDITKAKLIVSGGRGVGSKEKFDIVFNTAKALGGEVGASRAAVDADWVPYDHEIGQTGKTVSPDFYIAAGISGAIQHLVGMRNSKTIIVVNTDEEAPIIEIAHFALIADLHEVLPELIKQV